MALAAGALGGCGSSSPGTNADPASVTPASAQLYAGIAIKPSGGAGGVASVDAKTLTHLAEPYGSLAQALLSTQGANVEYKRDIEPWIGERAGLFVTAIGAGGSSQSAGSAQSLLEGGLTGTLRGLGAGSFGTTGVQGALVLDTSSVEGAQSFLNARAHEQHAHAASYRGVAYQVSGAGVAEGVVDRFAVIGSESALKSVIDTSLGAPAVTTASGYRKPPASAVASAYARPEDLLKTAHGSSASTQQGVTLLTALFRGAEEVSLWATPATSSIAIEGEAHYSATATPLFSQQGAQALGRLPGGSWLAGGIGDAGADMASALALLRGSSGLGLSSMLASLGGASIEKLLTELGSQSGLQREFASWAGSAGVFVSGTGLFNLQAGLVIESKDPAASRAAVGKLASLLHSSGAAVKSVQIAGADAAVSVELSGFPAVIYIADGQGKLIVGLGEASIKGAMSPSSTLSTSAAYSAAATALGAGIEPSLIVEFPTLLGFLEGIGLTSSPPMSTVAPYLKSLGTLPAGAGAGGQPGAQRFKLALGLAGG